MIDGKFTEYNISRLKNDGFVTIDEKIS